MNPSLSVSEFAPTPTPAYLSFADMGALVRRQRLHADKALQIDGRRFGAATVGVMRMAQAEEAINRLVKAARSREEPKARPQAIREALRVAKESDDPHELHYLTSMFINEPTVIKELAKNPHLPEKSQRVIAHDDTLAADVHVMRSLASNPSLEPGLMRELLNSSDDSIVRHEVARNAALKSRFAPDPQSPYVKLCDELVDTTYDNALRLTALPGVRSADVLRKIARTRDVVFGARELEAVADNSHTPVDVLAEMANVPKSRKMLHAAFGVTVAQKAARTLAELRHPEGPDAGMEAALT
ncbi:hypothetical protein [Burkholderia sp. Tr-20390]|uniref:hypothetical protein n=1 Tax=Burkholderia sp. Tr-20390 TaxID=2703904 RepID=UPI0019812A28|nr:hypothetical protein [Burkholderia sp. Tr-20390]MBN3729519.1 hypothetical protein [Burkholderia sp. Tr-20390]